MTSFKTLPEGPVTLRNVTVPGCILQSPQDLIRTDLHVADGRLTDVPGKAVEMGGAMVFPCFIDMHTHLDKGHIWPRSPNPDGTFMGALTTVGRDRVARWSAGDVRRRMEFSLRCAWAHGTRAIRTHLDSLPPQDEISWPVFAEMRDLWADRIALQASCLVAVDTIDFDGRFRRTLDLVVEHGGVLGMVTYPCADLETRLLKFLKLAEDRGLDVDFHVDETMDPTVDSLRSIAQAVIATGFPHRVTVGHCCSLSTQDDATAARTMDLVAQAGLHVVSLPMCNLYLQDRGPGTPRRRGITLVHELKARGVNVSFASDNTRDPFYAYGDLDMIEVMRQATRIGHLDHDATDWTNAFLANPAQACGLQPPSLALGAPADLVICKGRDWTELFARPQSDRIVLRAGRAIDTALPDYSDLDDLMEPA
ncbi:cytosine deaminase [Mangrovicoccus algicola]|uniref:Cytosine deaminase n=1 Tax=Mangrovicoccus algicola TaxID=2771008 RepID=A0A8J7CZD8_9RHOB|nr:cytosine deaminase [Mangrovicoccus algicola]MBE3637738.1 cytosine deaminase [Mangrovicoccus algicola]